MLRIANMGDHLICRLEIQCLNWVREFTGPAFALHQLNLPMKFANIKGSSHFGFIWLETRFSDFRWGLVGPCGPPVDLATRFCATRSSWFELSLALKLRSLQNALRRSSCNCTIHGARLRTQYDAVFGIWWRRPKRMK